MARLLGVIFAVSSAACLAAGPPQPDPITAISLWYRGNAAGMPVAADLALIRSFGFTSITWPADLADGARRVRQLAADADLLVVVRDRPAPTTPAAALTPGRFMDVDLTRAPLDQLPSLVWRGVAHGARAISLDAGPTLSLLDAQRQTQPWVRAALGVAGTFTTNVQLIRSLQSGPALRVDLVSSAAADARAVDLALLQDERSWILIATNTTPDVQRGVAQLPTPVPAALWVNLLDGATMSMLSTGEGPRWTFSLPPYAARVYIINKTAARLTS